MPPLLSVIVPARDAERVLSESLEALLASDLPRQTWELIVVDDASGDSTASVAGTVADSVIRLPGPARGPAYARNRGTEIARAEICVFVDADVCLLPDALSRILTRFQSDPALAAVVGSYDAATPNQGLPTQYRNLRHCYLRERAGGDVDTFWAPCGAIRRGIMLEVGQFDEWHYWRPPIEGIELGRRLRIAGHRILLDPAIRGVHLRSWTLLEMFGGDLRNLGVPWMRLLLQEGRVGSTRAPSISAAERFNTAATWAAVTSVSAFAMWQHPLLASASVASAFAMTVGTLPILTWFRRKRGLAFAVAAFPLQVMHYLVAGASVLGAWLLHQVVGEPRRDASVDALAEVGLETWPPVPRRTAADAWQPAGK